MKKKEHIQEKERKEGRKKIHPKKHYDREREER
jgi:hypothetical protein